MRPWVILVAILGLLGVLVQANDEPLTEVIDQELPFLGGGTIVLKNNDGSITVERWDRETVQLHIVKSMQRRDTEKAREIFQKSRVEIDASSERLEVVADFPELRRGVGISIDADFPFLHVGRGYQGPLPTFDYEVKIPAQVALEIHNDDGSVRISGHRGDLELHADDGEVHIADAEGDHMILSIDDGSMKIEGISAARLAFSGDDSRFEGTAITAEHVAFHQDDGRISLSGLACEEMEVEGDDGRVDAELVNGRGRYRFDGDDGTISLTLPEDTSLTMLLLMDDGSLDSEFPLPTQRFKAGERFEATIGSGEGRLEVRMDDGSISLFQQK